MSLFNWRGKDSADNLVRQVAGQLDALPEETARYVTAFAYLLGRIAHADRDFSADETRTMTDLVQMQGHLTGEQAALVVEIAKAQHRLFDGSDQEKVTRQFKKMMTPEQRHNLLHCIIAVAAANQEISASEVSVLRSVTDDLDLDKEEFEMILASYLHKSECP